MAMVVAAPAPAPDEDDFQTLLDVEQSVLAKMQGDERGGFDLCEQLSHGWAWAAAHGLGAAPAALGAHQYFTESSGSRRRGLFSGPGRRRGARGASAGRRGDAGADRAGADRAGTPRDRRAAGPRGARASGRASTRPIS